MTAPAHVTLAVGSTCDIGETDGTNVVLHANVASPPGSTLLVVLAGAAAPCRVKVRGCRRLSAAEAAEASAAGAEAGAARSFRIEGRFVDLTRDQRQSLTTNVA